jgi:hypothetical protein
MAYQQPYQQQRGTNDHQAADIRAFVPDVEERIARTRPGQPVPGLERIDGTDRSGSVRRTVQPTLRALVPDVLDDLR